MTAVRKPKPRREPSNLRELVLDLDERLEGGDALDDVWLPGVDWAELVEWAMEEEEPAQSRELPHPSAVRREKSQAAARDDVFAASLRKLLALELARALGAGVDTEWPDLLQIAQGYVMALDAERGQRKAAKFDASLVKSAVEAFGASAAAALVAEYSSAKEPSIVVKCADWDQALTVFKRGAEDLTAEEPAERPAHRGQLLPAKLRCPRCLGNCINEGNGKCTRGAAATRYEVLRELDPEQRAELVKCHPGWFCTAAADNGCVMQFDHAASCITFDQLEAKEKPEELEEEHPECPHCGEADGHKPEKCAMLEHDDRPTMVESLAKAELEQAAARARPKKRRATKKFPLGGDPLELCTVCGASYGDHDGQRCPKKQRRMKYVDEPATAEAPF